MSLLGKATDKEFWKQVRDKDCFARYRAELQDMWQKNCENGPIVTLTYTDFKRYWDTGDRGVYEGAYFTRRRAMDCAALLALVYPEEPKYLNRLMDQIFAICDEYTWCLPAHQGELEPNNNVKIDLFASETGFALAEIYTMLQDRLEPLIKNRIKHEVNRRIFEPFRAVEEYGWWEHGTNNWTAVCVGSVACAAMLLQPELARELLPRCNKDMEFYLSGFEDDGICIEGCGYWHYGFGFFTVYADMVKIFTEGETDWFKLDKVRKISTFIQKMFLSGNACVSFADGQRTTNYHLGLCHYLKKLYPDDVVVYDPKYSYNYDGCGRFCLQLRSATWLDEELYYNPAPDNCVAEYYAEGSEWFIKRTAAYGFAAKGGNNHEHHNNNDVGTFIFAKNGRQVLVDPGAGVYSRQYFSKDTRYTILECSSRGHSVPMVDGALQFYGREAAAEDVRYEDGVFSLEFARAYKCPGLDSIKRQFSFSEDSVTVNDRFGYTGQGDIVERIVTLYQPKVGEGKVSVEDVEITFDPSVCTVAISDEMSERGYPFYFIDFKLNEGVREFTCKIK